MKFFPVLFTAFAALSTAAPRADAATGNAVTIDGKHRKALVLVWDGCRGDVASDPAITPNLHALAERGTYTWKAFAGGIRETETETMTVTACGFHNIFTGVWGNKHKITSNSAETPDYEHYPTFFKRLAEKYPGISMAGYFGWDAMYTDWVSRENNSFDLLRHTNKVEEIWQDEAVSTLKTNAALDLFFYECWEPDDRGHGSGFSPENPAYTEKVHELDGKLGDLVNAITNRATYGDEEWLVIVTTDHGGINKSHGGQTWEERWIPLVVAGAGVPAGRHCEFGPGHTAVHPTLLKHFGVEIDPAWGLESRPFGNETTGPEGIRVVGKDAASRRVTLGWAPPLDGGGWTVTVSPGAPGAPVSTNADAGVLSWEHPWTNGAVFYTAVAEKGGAAPVTNVIPVTMPLPVIACSPLVSGLCSYLTADGTTACAYAGLHEPKAVNGNPGYVSDGGRRAFDFKGKTWWMNLGNYPSMNTNSFTVGIWIKPWEANGTDVAFLGTEDWERGDAPGWCLTPVGSGLNIGATLGPRRGCYVTFVEGAWTYLSIVFDRKANAITCYQDGKKTTYSAEFMTNGCPPGALLCDRDFSLGGSGATGGLLGRCYLDDVAVWDRALTGAEAAEAYNRWGGGLDAMDAGAGFTLGETTFTPDGDGGLTVEAPVLLKAGKESAAVSLYLADRDYGPDGALWPEGSCAAACTVSASPGKAVAGRTVPAGAETVVARWAADDGAGKTILSEPQIHLTGNGYGIFRNGLTHYLPLDGDTLNLVTGEIEPVTGAAAYTDDSPSGLAARFDGDWHFSLGRPGHVNTNSFTFGLWLKTRSEDNEDKSFLGTQDWSNGKNLGFGFFPPDYGCFGWSVKAYEDRHILDDWQEKDVWIYVMAVFDRGNDTVTLYKNGERAGKNSWKNASVPDGFAFMAEGMSFNFGADGRGRYAGKSTQDDVALWSRALSAAEARLLFTAAKGNLKAAVRNAFIVSPRLDETADGFRFSGTLRACNVEVEGAGVVYGPADPAGEPAGASWKAADLPPGPDGGEGRPVSLDAECGKDGPVYARPFTVFGGVTNLGPLLTLLPQRKKAALLRGLHIYLPLENHALNLAESDAAVTPSAHGDAAASPQYVPSRANLGRMASFSADTWFIDAGKPPFLATNDFTVSLWLYCPETGTDGGVMGTEDWISGANPGWALANGYFNFQSDTRHRYMDNDGSGGIAKEWAYYTISVNRAGRIIEIYVNGDQVRRYTGDEVDSASELHDMLPDSLRIGAPQGSREWQRASVQDEVAVWSRALSKDDVAALYGGMRGMLAEAVEAVSFDFRAPGGADPLGDDACYGAFPCKGRYWNRLTEDSMEGAGGWVNNAGIGTGGLRITYAGGGVRTLADPDGRDPLLRGRLAGGSPAGSITIANVPFKTYDLYLYKGCGAEAPGAFAPVQVGGRYYKPDARGFAAACGSEDGWGGAGVRDAVPGASGNVMILTNLTGNVTVGLPPGGEGQGADVAAFQIVNRNRPTWKIPRGTLVVIR